MLICQSFSHDKCIHLWAAVSMSVSVYVYMFLWDKRMSRAGWIKQNAAKCSFVLCDSKSPYRILNKLLVYAYFHRVINCRNLFATSLNFLFLPRKWYVQEASQEKCSSQDVVTYTRCPSRPEDQQWGWHRGRYVHRGETLNASRQSKFGVISVLCIYNLTSV